MQRLVKDEPMCLLWRLGYGGNASMVALVPAGVVHDPIGSNKEPRSGSVNVGESSAKQGNGNGPACPDWIYGPTAEVDAIEPRDSRASVT